VKVVGAAAELQAAASIPIAAALEILSPSRIERSDGGVLSDATPRRIVRVKGRSRNPVFPRKGHTGGWQRAHKKQDSQSNDHGEEFQTISK
jgi:hypothetical protein